MTTARTPTQSLRRPLLPQIYLILPLVVLVYMLSLIHIFTNK